MAAPGYWERQIGTKDPAEALGTMLYLLIKGGSEPRKEFAKKAQEEADKLEQEREMYKLNKQIAEAQYKLLLFHAKKEVDVDIAQKKFWNMPPDKMFENSHTDPPITTPYGTAGGGTISLPGGLGAIAQPNPPNRRGPMFSPITPHEGPPRPLTLPSISIPQTTLPFEQSQSPTRRPAPLGVTPQLSPSTRMLSQEAILAARKAGIDPRTLGFPMPEDIAKERRTAQLEEKRSARSLRDRLTVMNADFAHRRKLARDKQEARVNEEALKPKDMTYDETITAMNAIRAGDVPPPELAGRKPFPGMEKVWSDSMELRDKEGDNAILRNAIKVTKDQSGNSLFDIDLSELLNLKQMKFEEAAKVLTTFLDTPEQMVRASFGPQFVQADLQKLQAQAAEALYWITPDPTLGIKGVDEDGQPVHNTPLDKRLENSTKSADANLALGKSGMSLRLGTLIGNLPAGTPLPALPGISNPGVPPGSLRKPAPIKKREHPETIDFVVTQGTRADGTPYRSRTIRGKLPAGREVPNREAGITYLMKRGKLTRPKAAALWDHHFGRGR